MSFPCRRGGGPACLILWRDGSKVRHVTDCPVSSKVMTTQHQARRLVFSRHVGQGDHASAPHILRRDQRARAADAICPTGCQAHEKLGLQVMDFPPCYRRSLGRGFERSSASGGRRVGHRSAREQCARDQIRRTASCSCGTATRGQWSTPVQEVRAATERTV
jgi:hypothetical protein